ncbi:MAG TPA: hypothetical protein H9982_06620 [Candidatus Barnesiella excrementipullorum]|uniref:Transmembrane protein n=1 Tax=Candidatus Barnesiella excrementipullorum TaxID=2838479 RepID=A0A9D2AQ77_9BACT|nr:hypothetical protein [Candidatus Barnesiella excrementipullorum]
MKTILLPHYMRIIGWILFVPCLLVGVLILVEALSLNGVVGVVVNDTAIIGIAIGSLFICCSRERQEDEMMQAVRLQALMVSLYVYVGLLIVCTLIINDLAYLYFMIANLCLFPVVFLLVFKIMIARYIKEFDDEKQD